MPQLIIFVADKLNMPPFVDDDASSDVCSTVNVVDGIMTHDDFLEWSNWNRLFIGYLC